MSLSLLKKGYNIYIISFTLLTSLFSSAVSATPSCPIITNQFQGANGTTIDNSATGWSVDSSLLTRPHPTGFFFALNSNRFTATNLGAVGIVNSHVFSIAGYMAPQVSVKITAEGAQNSTEYIQFYYKLNGGTPVLVATQTGNFGTLTFTSPTLSGSTVQLIIKIYDYNNGTGTKSNYYIERYDVFQTKGPCTPGNASITVTPSATNQGVLSCTNTSTTLSAISPTTGLAYFWTGPNNFATTSVSPSVSVAGTYTLIVTTGTPPATTLWGTANITITINTTPPASVTASSPTVLTCTSLNSGLTATSATSGATFKWSGPGSFTATGATATATLPGTYTATATNPANGCTATATTSVVQTLTTPASETVTGSNVLNCTTTSTTLTATSTTSGVTFKWTGPGTFAATGATVIATVPGTYSVTGTNPTTGCTAKVNDTVVQTSTMPAPVVITTLNNVTQLTCSTNSVTITGNSSTAGVTYSWTGPNSFTSTSPIITVFAPGLYTLSAANGTSGCASSAAITITQNITPPDSVSISPTLATINCSNPIAVLTGHSSTSGATLNWSGPNSYTETGTTAVASAGGEYILTVTNPADGCTSSTAATITQDFAQPSAITAINNGPLTCSKGTVTLTGNSTTPGVNYNWTGAGFTAATAIASTTAPGSYTVVVTNPANGCTGMAVTIVTKDSAAPSALSITSNTGNSILNCTNPVLGLKANSATSGLNFSWNGPAGFSATGLATTATAPGLYTLLATNPVNGCAATTSTTLTQDTATPAALTTSSVPTNAILTCTSPNVVLTGSSSTPGVNYSWTGPNSFVTSGAVATATLPGTYTLTVTNTGNGCFSTVAASAVTQNITVPVGVSANASSKLTCFTTNATLTGNSTTSGASFNWSGPGGFNSTSRVTSVTQGGAYTLTVTNPANGCISTKSLTVLADTATPAAVTATNSGPLTCDITSVTLTGTSKTPGVSYIWSGPNGFFDEEQVSDQATDSGEYVLTVTNPVNGCTTTAITIVAQDLTECSMVTPKTANGQSASLNAPGMASDSSPATRFEYKAYPNPASTMAFIEFRSPSEAQVKIEIRNSLGILERTLFSNNVEANMGYKLSFDAASFTTGIHYCIIRVNNNVYSSKLLFVPNRL